MGGLLRAGLHLVWLAPLQPPEAKVPSSAARCRWQPAVTAICLALAVVVSPALSAGEVTTVYVAPGGSDANTGKDKEPGATGPKSTIDGALERVRELRRGGVRALRILVLPGTYRVREPIVLGPEDSGSADLPLYIEGTDRAEVVLTGSHLVGDPVAPDPAMLARISPAIRPTVQAFDLARADLAGWVDLAERGVGYTTAASSFPSELFAGGVPIPLARWPETGYLRVNVSGPADRHSARFALAPPPPPTWQRPMAAWAFGYWGNDWADALLRVTITGRQTVSIDSKLPPYGIRDGQRAYLTNVPESLTARGQWFLDAVAAKAYLAPAPERLTDVPEISLAQDIIVLNGARNVVLRHLTLQNSRRFLLSASDVDTVVLEHCTLKNAGYTAAEFLRARKSGVRHCDVLRPGASGVVLSGGDRRTLEASENFASDNRITAFGRTYRTYQPAVRISGVGVRVEHNDIRQGPHAAILFSGNDHYIGNNEIQDVVTETRDAGAIYCGRDWTARGTLIEHNFVHDVGAEGEREAIGVYLDDQASGITVRRNVFVRVGMGVLVGGGLDNVVEDNLFAATSPAVHIDERGMNAQRSSSIDPNGELHRNLRAVPWDAQPYLSRYPTLAQLLSDGPGIPRRNVIRGNLAVDGVVEDIQLSQRTRALQRIDLNRETSDQWSVWGRRVDLHAARDLSDFLPAPGSHWTRQGFERLELMQVGPR